MLPVNSWEDFFKEVKKTMYFQNIETFLNKVYQERIVYPPRELVFNAFSLTPLQSIKVVILGQDPYHNIGEAMGLAFSVPSGIKIPPSLRNIFKEMDEDIRKMPRNSGDLTYLARQGVFLFNTILTVEEGSPLSHNRKEYEAFTHDVISTISLKKEPVVFILWGAKAKVYQRAIKGNNNLVITANHPSPLSANQGGFFGTKPFSRTNKFLIDHGATPINWNNG